MTKTEWLQEAGKLLVSGHSPRHVLNHVLDGAMADACSWANEELSRLRREVVPALLDEVERQEDAYKLAWETIESLRRENDAALKLAEAVASNYHVKANFEPSDKGCICLLCAGLRAFREASK